MGKNYTKARFTLMLVVAFVGQHVNRICSCIHNHPQPNCTSALQTREAAIQHPHVSKTTARFQLWKIAW